MWELVNPMGGPLNFNKKTFAMAMHLLFKKKTGTELPNTLPPELRLSVDPEGFFAEMENRMNN